HPVGIVGRRLQVEQLPPAEVGPGDAPPLAGSIRLEDERPLACADEHPNATHVRSPFASLQLARAEGARNPAPGQGDRRRRRRTRGWRRERVTIARRAPTATIMFMASGWTRVEPR